MNSILNSISSGDLQVLDTPRENPVKKDSIIDLLQNSEIEFKTCLKLEHNNLQNFNTGFGKNNDLQYNDICKKPELNTPLYKENYFKEFVSEEEKAAARHALGLYNKEDVVMMSLLTAEDVIPSQSDLENTSIKELRKGDKFFAPATLFDAVFDSQGTTLTKKLKNVDSLIKDSQKEILKINQISNSKTISSLGDVKLFLEGFNNGDTLNKTFDEFDKKIMRFEITGQIIN